MPSNGEGDITQHNYIVKYTDGKKKYKIDLYVMIWRDVCEILN